MPALLNRFLVGLGLIGSLAMTGILLVHYKQPVIESLPQFSYWLALFAAVISVLAACFAISSIDRTGITDEGRITSIMPIVLAACGLALTVRWAPDRLPFALAWLVLHAPGVVVGFKTPTSNLQQSLKRQQSIEDRRIAIEWELRQLTNRLNLLERLVRPGGPDPQAQKKLATTGNTLEKYYADTREQLDKFLQQVEDDAQRTTANQMLVTLQQMDVKRQ